VGNPHAGFDEAGAGNVTMGAGLRPRTKVLDEPPDPKVSAPVLDPTCEGVGVKFPRATRPLIHTFPTKTSAQNVGGGSQQVSDHKLKYDMFSQTRIAKC